MEKKQSELLGRLTEERLRILKKENVSLPGDLKNMRHNIDSFKNMQHQKYTNCTFTS